MTGSEDLRALLMTLTPSARHHLRDVLIRDHANRDADLLPVGITQSCRCEESVNDHVRGMFAKQVDLVKLPFSAP
jgi:hypothetical protein